MIQGTQNKDEYVSPGMKVLLLLFSIFSISGCLVLFIPEMRGAVISFGENIVHRQLNFEIWNQRLVSTAILGILINAVLWLSISVQFSRFAILDKRKRTLYTLGETLLVCFFALELIVLALSNKAIWVDEAFSLAPIHHSFREILLFQSVDVHPPLFFLLEKCWSLAFGDSIFSIKFVSILLAVLTMILAAWFLKKEVSDNASILFLLCFIASVPVIHYSIEIRMYSLALFFVTASAISVWYIITDGKVRWWIIFLLSAEGAAYTHYYAMAVAGIGHIMLFCYIMRYDRKKIISAILTVLGAIVLYLPWFPAFLNNFARVSNDFWIKPLTIFTVLEYVRFLFDMGDFFATLFFLIIFCVLFFVFLAKKKTKIEYFTFYGLLSLIILVITGIVISIMTRPLLVERYLYPALALVFIFFSVECGLIQNKRVILFMASVLFIFGIHTFVSTLKQEQQEDKGFKQYHAYLSENIKNDDVFIYFPGRSSSHLTIINAYLFPGHVNMEKEYFSYEDDLFYHMFDSTFVTYNNMVNPDTFNSQSAWIIVMDTDKNKQPIDFIIPSNVDAEFHGLFGWGDYKFKLYHTKSLPGLIGYFMEIN
jgi:4-amino-4-deoxy-L-arabinose transferase-like glycosyltransferase